MKYFLPLFIFLGLQMNAQNPPYLQAPFLKQGDTILIVAPAGIVKQPQAIKLAKETFERYGYTVLLGKNVFKKHHHFAGTDAERLTDMQWALDHPTAKAIWCARGGYGSVRIIDDLDFTLFKQKPKWLIGYSDFTVIHNHLHNLGYQTLHAAMPINFKEPWLEIKQSIEGLENALRGEELNYSITSNSQNINGTAKGYLIGGNLTILENMLGTNTCIDPKNKILFIEEIGEHKYHIDRLLRALDRKGYFKNCSGLILGDFTHIKSNSPDFGQTIEEIILTLVKKYNIPVLFDFPAGHKDKNMPMIFGKEIQLTVTTNTMSTVKSRK